MIFSIEALYALHAKMYGTKESIGFFHCVVSFYVPWSIQTLVPYREDSNHTKIANKPII